MGLGCSASLLARERIYLYFFPFQFLSFFVRENEILLYQHRHVPRIRARGDLRRKSQSGQANLFMRSSLIIETPGQRAEGGLGIRACNKN